MQPKSKHLIVIEFMLRFCPSIFLYLASVCPSIWLIELDKLDTRLAKKEMMENSQSEMAIVNATKPAASAIPASASSVPTPTNGSKVDLGVLKDVGVI